MKKIHILILMSFFLCSCDEKFEKDLSKLLTGKESTSTHFYHRTFEIHDWGPKDSINLTLRYLGEGKIAYKINSESGKIHNISHIRIVDSQGIPLLNICDYCSFYPIQGGGKGAEGFLQESLELWNTIIYDTSVSYRAKPKKG